MATQNLGRVGLVLKGEWDSTTAYTALDVVSHDGNAWAAKQNSTNVEPTTGNSDFWQLFSNNADLVATVQGLKESAESSAAAAALSAQKAEEESELGANAMQGIAPVFAPTESYAVEDYVWYRGILYRFTETHSAGEWIGTDAEETKVGTEIQSVKAYAAPVAQTALSPTLMCLGGMNFVAVPETLYNRRRFTVDRNRIQMAQNGDAYSSYLTFVLTNEFRAQSGALSSFAPILADLVPITKYPTGCDMIYYLDRLDSSSGVAHLSAVFVSVGGENAITVLGREALARFTDGTGMHRRSMADPPAGTTHFALFVYSNKNDFDFDCVFEIVPRVTEPITLMSAMSNDEIE